MTGNEKRQFFTVADVAKRWQISTRTVWREIDRGDLPVHRLAGRVVRISMEDLLLYEAKRGRLMSFKVN